MPIPEWRNPHAMGVIQRALEKVRVLAKMGKLTTGICDPFALEIPRKNKVMASYWIQHHFTCWPKYSGDSMHPIPNVDGCNPSHQYHIARYDKTLWDRDTEYGRLRWGLLDYLIEQVKKELADVSPQNIP